MDNEKKILIFKGSIPLPEEIIIFEIFSRLPVKSFYRFRSISKFCHSLTYNPEFLDAVRRHSRRRFLLSFSSTLNWRCLLHSLTPGFRRLHVPKIVDYLANAACCNYIRCINALHVSCKETVSSSVTLQHTRNSSFHRSDMILNLTWTDTFSFSVMISEQTSTKVLRLVSTRTENPMNGHLEVVATDHKIFTVGVDISWRDFDQPGFYQLGKSKSVCIDGVLSGTNFKVITSSVEGTVIAASDVGNEYLDVVAYPYGLSSSRYGSCHLIEVKGSAGIMELESHVIRLWIKEKGVVSGSNL